MYSMDFHLPPASSCLKRRIRPQLSPIEEQTSWSQPAYVYTLNSSLKKSRQSPRRIFRLRLRFLLFCTIYIFKKLIHLRRNPIENRAISGFSGQKPSTRIILSIFLSNRHCKSTTIKRTSKFCLKESTHSSCACFKKTALFWFYLWDINTYDR